jgi:hypothetical protein
MSNLIRSASLTNYPEVARAAGLDPLVLLAGAGLSPACLHDPDLRIPSDAVRALFEASATASGLDNFGLRMAETRQLSNLGAVALMAREEPTVRRFVRAMTRYSHVLNESLFLKLEESNGIAVLREEFLVRHHGSSRQATELLVGVTFRSLKFFLGPTWNPLRVCFVHAPPRDPSVVDEFEDQIKAWHRSCELSIGLEKIPGIGPLGATALVASIADANSFDNGRQLSAWLGLVPRQHSSGGKPTLLGISKRGDVYLRTLLIHGARSAIVAAQNKAVNTNVWLASLLNRRHPNVAAVALANKNVRTVWALLAHGKEFRPSYVPPKLAA